MDFENPEFAQVASKTKATMNSQLDPSQTVNRAGTMLRMARQGFRDMHETDHDRILFGFLGVVVFGRSMTLVMQNLRSFDQVAFDSWYAPWKKEMKNDLLMLYFCNLRTKVIHQDAPAIGILLGGFGENIVPIGSITIDGLSLPDSHLGHPLDDISMKNLSRLYVEYLQRIFDSFAPVAFAIQDRLTSACSKRRADERSVIRRMQPF